MAKVSVLGAGSWGTALAVMLHGNHHQVTLWSALSDEVAQLRRDREQKGKLPGVHIPEDINITDCLEEAVKDREMLVLAVPSVFVRGTARQLSGLVPEGQLIVCVAKGVEEDTLMTMTDIIEQELPVDYILTQMNMPWLRYIFQIVLFGTLIETGSGLIYSITDRIAEAFKNKGQEVPKWSTPVVAVILLVGTTAISSFGLTGLIAKGYGTLAWVMFIVYVIPILTLGIYKISKAKKN